MAGNGLAYGLREMPEVKAAWGARMIFPNDLVHDRTDMCGDRDDKDKLLAWLSSVPQPNDLRFINAVHANTGPRDENVFTIFEDDKGIMQASAQSSSGYLYVSAWLKEHVILPAAKTDYYIVAVDSGGDVMAIRATEVERKGLDITVKSVMPNDDGIAGPTASFENKGNDDEDIFESVRDAMAAVLISYDEE